MARFLFFFSLGAACSGTGEGESGWSSHEIALHTLSIIRVMTFQNITTSLKYYSTVLHFAVITYLHAVLHCITCKH